MRFRILSILLGLTLLASFTAIPAAAQTAQTPKVNTAIPVTLNGTFPNGNPGTFTGTFNLQKFQNVGGTLTAVGTLTGTVTQTVNGSAQQVGNITALPVQLPVIGAAAGATCDILNLTLGPIHLNLLGLVVDTNQIVLNITAQSGAGNLLGNLLCGVANLLNSNASVNGLVQSLNNLLGLV
ncbi:MAG TPA: hypothetical protein VK009_00360 [Chloroflexota bacterium]|nr:hypothetical protein [Chloroflexota bacterium]